MLLFAVVLAVLLIIAYWIMRWRSSGIRIHKSISILLFILLTGGLITLAYIDSMDRTIVENNVPVLIAIATDLSLSMGTKPDPRNYGDVGTRLERAQKILLPIINALDASSARVMISITGFTATSETILGWDDNLPQIREVLEYVITPGILTQPGSDLGVALQGVIPIFDNLPEEYLSDENKKFLIVVSDGEQTLERGDLAAALADLNAKGVSVMALHVGSPDDPEGLPVYDQAGAFLGFQDIGGQIYSVPDSETMTMIAGTDTDKGLYVNGENSSASSQISEFIGVQMSSTSSSSPLYMGAILLLIGLSLTILLWFI